MAARLRSGELDAEEAAELRPAMRRAGHAGSGAELDAPRALGRQARGPGAPALSVEAPAYPVELQQRVHAYLEAAALRLGRARRPASRRRCGTRCSPAASGSARCSPSRPPRRSGATPREVLPLAAAIEMIHTYSLIHDDLPAMDDDELRRGKPTCHVAFGEDVAILAGDGLFAEALRLALGEQSGEPEAVLAAVRELVGAAGVNGMVGGQFLDVGGPADVDLRRIHELKTGALIAASVGPSWRWSACPDLPQCRTGASRPSLASSSRSSTTSST